MKTNCAKLLRTIADIVELDEKADVPVGPIYAGLPALPVAPVAPDVPRVPDPPDADGATIWPVPDVPTPSDTPVTSNETIRGVVSNYISESGLRFLTIGTLIGYTGYFAITILDACSGPSDDTGLVVSVRRADNTVIIRLA